MRKKQKRSCESILKGLPKLLLKPVPIMVTVIVLLVGVIAMMGIANVIENSDQVSETPTGIRAAAAGDDFEWIGQYGTSVYDNAEDIFVGTANDIYVIGSTKGALPGQISAGQSDVYFSKYDGNLDNEVWTKQFGTAGIDKGYAITVKDGFIYIVGSVGGSLPGQSSAGSIDAFISKYDKNGQEIWTRQFGTSYIDEIFTVYADETGVYVAGDTAGILAGEMGGVFIRKYDETGNEIWTSRLGSEIGAKDHISAIYGNIESRIICVTGYTEGTLPDQISAGGTDSFIATYFIGDGTEIWTKQFGSTGNDSSTGVFIDDSGIYMVGSVVGILPGQTSAGGVIDAYIKKYNDNGEELWTRQFGTLGNDNAADVFGDSSMIYIGGNTSGSFPNFSNAGNLDVYISAYNINGDETRTTQFGTSDYDLMRGIYFSGTVYAVGETSGAFSGQINAGDRDAWVAKLGTLNTPIGSIVNVSFPNIGSVTFETVTAAGNTGLIEYISYPPLAPALPAGYEFNRYYTSSTTAIHTGSVALILNYDDTGLTEDEEQSLKVMHYQTLLGRWVDITEAVNASGNSIAGRVLDSASYDNNHNYAIVLPNTPIGSIVDVSFPNIGSVTFETVTAAGNTTVDTSNTAPAPLPTGGYTVLSDLYYDINTTATHTGAAALILNYDDTGLNEAEEQSLQLLHYENGKWVDITEAVNALGNSIAGRVLDPVIFDNNPYYAVMYFSINTPVGSIVNVSFPNIGSVTFDTVTAAGNTTVETSNTAPAPLPTGGYTVLSDLYYDINTTAIHTRAVAIILNYDDTGLTEDEEQSLKVMHYENGQWVDITESVNALGNTIEGRVLDPVIFDNNPYYAVMFSYNTPVGSIVKASFPNIGSVTFETVTVAGNTTVDTSNTAPAPLSTDYTVLSDLYYDINTTATHTGSTALILNYDDTGLTEDEEQSLKVMHYENGQWMDITESVNALGNSIAGRVLDPVIFDNNPYYAVMFSYNTPVGSIVKASFPNIGSVTFETVTAAGNTTVDTSNTAPAPLSTDYTVLSDLYYDINTTATHTGSTALILNYDDTGLTEDEEQSLKVMHYENGQWMDITESVNALGNSIAGRVLDPVIFDNNPYYAVVRPNFNTPVGDGVWVYPLSYLSVQYWNVTVAGTTMAMGYSVPTIAPVPEGYEATKYYDVMTTAEHNGPTMINITYDDTGLTEEQEEDLKILHYENGQWVELPFGVLNISSNAIGGQVENPVIFDNNSYYAVAYFAGNTPVGDGVWVYPLSYLSVQYWNVTVAGTTMAMGYSVPTIAPVPEGYEATKYYDVMTTAEHNGPTMINITYDDTGLTEEQEEDLKILHYENGQWVELPFGVLNISSNAIGGQVENPVIFDNNSYYAVAYFAGNTPVGDGVWVYPLSYLSVQYWNVTVAGTTMAMGYSVPTIAPVPEGYEATKYYDVMTTAEHNGPTMINITYDDTGLTEEQEEDLKILHYENGQWVELPFGVLNISSNAIGGQVENPVIFDNNSYYAVARPTVNTPIGSGVEVNPSDNISLEFDQVTSAGETIITPVSDTTRLPNGFSLSGEYFDISTTASYTGTITIAIHYEDFGMLPKIEINQKLMHYENDQWVDITTSIDTVNNIIYGEVTSLSHFAVAYPDTLIQVQVDKHIVGSGTKPIPTKQPLVGVEVRLYERSDIEDAGFTPINWQSMPDITASSLNYVSSITNVNGEAYFGEAPSDYILVAVASGITDYKHLWTPIDADDSEWVPGGQINKYLQLIEKADGSKVPGKSRKYSGSEIIIIEPEYIEWDSVEETYPFLMISQDSWGVEVAIEPPEGYEADYPELIETTPEYKAVQFTVTEIGSVPDKTKVKMKLKNPQGKTTKHESKIDVKLSKKLAKEKGIKINKHGGVIDETGAAAFFKKIGRFFKSFFLGR